MINRPATTSTSIAAQHVLHSWCPPTQDRGRYRALLQTLDSSYTRVQSEQQARCASLWLARRWLQHHASRHTGQGSAAVPYRASVDEMSGDVVHRPGIYEACGPAAEVVTALGVLADARGERTPVTGNPDIDAATLSALLDAYEPCLRQLATTDDPNLRHYRILLRHNIAALLTTSTIPPTVHQQASARLRGADLSRLIRADGAFLTVIDHPNAHHPDTPPPATERRPSEERFASARHAREYLIHTLTTDTLVSTRDDVPASLSVEILDTRTTPPTVAYQIGGTATDIADTLAAVTDFDGAYLLGIPDIDARLLTALVADYRHNATTLAALATDHDRTDDDSDAHLVWLLHTHQQRRREIEAMLTDTDLAAHTSTITAQMAAADAVLGIGPAPHAAD
ncbi:hypothetical protein, partial [Nocardia noduli]|uniref:hypothetical protein n=1 Tax=Nocardia noduli TaxID=2815722 RepID=UPI001C243D3F